MKNYAKLIVRGKTSHIDNLFTYKIPDYIKNDIKIGHRVSVPFGRGNKPVEGFIFEIIGENEDNFKTKEIIDVLDEDPILTSENIELIKWMKNRYLCTYMDCINLMYPKGYKLNNYKVVTLLVDEFEPFNLNKSDMDVINNVIENKGKIKLEKLNKVKGLNNTLLKLKKLGIIDIYWEYNSHKNEKSIYYVCLKDEDGIDDYINNNKIRLGIKQQEIIDYLKSNSKTELSKIIKDLDLSKSSILSLVKKDLIAIIEEDFYRIPENNYKVKNIEISLNKEQKQVADIIISNMYEENKKPYLIHGITGSGKTEVYIKVIENALNEGLDSIVLVPEIALTPQTISRFKNKFGNIVSVFHSQLSEGEKHDVYRNIREGNTRILIGARSALFAPFNSLGVIIIDECHENSYKSDQNPKFSSIEVARYMSLKNNVTLIMGSATPSIDEYYKALKDEYVLLEINKRANNKPLPNIEVIDMKNELEIGNKSIFSVKLLNEIKSAVSRDEQVILFLNRRGYSNFVSCRKCGYVFECSNCDISLTYHKYNNSGRCHYCGFEKEIPKTCPECESKYVKPFGVGTQKIEEELKELLPNTNILRMDKDTTSKKGELEDLLNKFKNKEANILIGTQMLSKGLDFEDVTLVGILSADMILKFPDFKSSETTFQLITQVSGRAGRSDKEGKVILQTYDTDHYAIRRAMNYDFKGFYEDEIKIRKVFEYSPFNNMISVVISGENEGKVRKNINQMYESIKYLLIERNITDFDFILGPNPCSISKINKNYRYQILFKDDNIEINLLKGIIKYICITKRDMVFDNDINISIDINPCSVL